MIQQQPEQKKREGLHGSAHSCTYVRRKMPAWSGLFAWVLYTVVLGSITLALAIIAIRRRSMGPFWFSLLFLMLTAGCAAMATYRLATGVYQRTAQAMEPVGGMRSYEAFFGKPVGDCVVITHHRDQIIPIIDTSILIRLRTCPSEIRRILGQRAYTSERGPAMFASGPHGTEQNEFSPEALGDTVLTYYTELVPGRNWRWVHCNIDSTAAIIVDVLD